MSLDWKSNCSQFFSHCHCSVLSTVYPRYKTIFFFFFFFLRFWISSKALIMVTLDPLFFVFFLLFILRVILRFSKFKNFKKKLLGFCLITKDAIEPSVMKLFFFSFDICLGFWFSVIWLFANWSFFSRAFDIIYMIYYADFYVWFLVSLRFFYNQTRFLMNLKACLSVALRKALFGLLLNDVRISQFLFDY